MPYSSLLSAPLMPILQPLFCLIVSLSYAFILRSRIIEGTEVIEETYSKKQTSSEDIPRRGPDAPPQGHNDIITDVNLCQASQCLVLTASSNGVVKVWK